MEKNRDSKEKAINWAEKNLVGESVYNQSIGSKILFTRQGIKHAISARMYPRKIALIYDLRELLGKAILITIKQDRKGRADVKKVYELFTEWNYEGKTYMVYIIVRLMNNGHIYYDHEVTKEKNLS